MTPFINHGNKRLPIPKERAAMNFSPIAAWLSQQALLSLSGFNGLITNLFCVITFFSSPFGVSASLQIYALLTGGLVCFSGTLTGEIAVRQLSTGSSLIVVLLSARTGTAGAISTRLTSAVSRVTTVSIIHNGTSGVISGSRPVARAGGAFGHICGRFRFCDILQ